MPKPQKKGKGPRGPGAKSNFDEDSLAQLTSKIDQSLGSNDHKRKKPPTEGNKQQHKKQRNSDGSQPPKNKTQEDQEALLAEILALGGDENDLDIINGVDSEDEIDAKESTERVDKKLRDELLEFSKELGFASIEPEIAAEEEESSEVENDDDNDESEGDVEDDETKRVRKPGDLVRDGQKGQARIQLIFVIRYSSRELTGMPTNLQNYQPQPLNSSALLPEPWKLLRHAPKPFWTMTLTNIEPAYLPRPLISSCPRSCLQVRSPTRSQLSHWRFRSLRSTTLELLTLS